MGRRIFEWVIPEKMFESTGRGLFGTSILRAKGCRYIFCRERKITTFALSQVDDILVEMKFGSRSKQAIFQARDSHGPGVNVIVMEVVHRLKAKSALYLPSDQATPCLDLVVGNE